MAKVEYKADKLSTNNYTTWKTIIKSQLMGKDLWQYVNQLKNSDDEDKIKNEQAKSIIYLSMEPQEISATGTCETAHQLWAKIKENHEGALSNLRSTAMAEFLSIKIQHNETLIAYAGRFENLLGKLEMATAQPVDEKMKLWAFSNSLPAELKRTVQMFEMAKPEGSVSELISQMKLQYHLEQNDEKKAGAYYMNTNRTNIRHNQNRNFNRQSDSKPAPPSCTYCKRIGHIWSDCRKLKADNERKRRFAQNRQIQSAQTKPQANKNSGAFNVTSHPFSGDKFAWLVDSGASEHVTKYREFLKDYIKFEEPHKIIIGDGQIVEAYGQGTLFFRSQAYTGQLNDVLWIPKISENLFSVSKAMHKNCNVQFCTENSKVYFYRNEELVLEGTRDPESSYFFIYLYPTEREVSPQAGIFLNATEKTWHRRLCHNSLEMVKYFSNKGAILGMNISESDKQSCEACILGKQCRAHHPSRNHIEADEKTAILHFDTVGPLKEKSLGGSIYFILATEEYSGYMINQSMGSKAQIPDAVKRTVMIAEIESKRPVKAIYTDQGTEYLNTNLESWLKEKGIVHYLSTTYTPEQNGRAERANRTVIDGIRTLLADSKQPEKLWAEALNTFVYTTNRVTGKKELNKTKYELFTGKKPDISNLRIFGQRALIRIPNNLQGSKLAPRSREGMFIGYTSRSNTYRFYVNETKEEVITSCDAKFIDSESDKSFDTEEPSQDTVKIELYESNNEINQETNSEFSVSSNESSDYESVGAKSPLPDRRETRSMKKVNENKGPALIGLHLCGSLSDHEEPRTLEDARNSSDWPEWQKAIKDELDALHKNKTWIIVDRPEGIRPIKNKWVFRLKLDSKGEIERFKARLVAKGYSQIANVDYQETYAPVASFNTVRILLAIASKTSMHLIQFDIKTAFLHGDLDEELFMEMPEGEEQEGKVCKLTKSLYGLKQAPRNWNKKFDHFLKLFKLRQSQTDRCVYFNQDRSIILAIYVDDGLAAGRNRSQLEGLIDYLKENFELTKSTCQYYLGLNISRNFRDKTIDIDQHQYIEKILNRFNMQDCSPVPTPEQVGGNFENSSLLPTQNNFKELVGSLLYLATISRPDISHAVSIASRTSQPTEAHWQALKRILRYLKGTSHLKIRYDGNKGGDLVGFSDSDYANDLETRRSTTGYVILFNGSPVAWRCQRQPIITLSTTEAEYVAGCDLVRELLPIREQLTELHQINQQTPTDVFIDNLSTVRISNNEEGQKRTKHIDIREKWLTEQSMKKRIAVKHIPGTEQIADILTKPLTKNKFLANRMKLLISLMVLGCAVSNESRVLQTTEPLTTVASDKVFIRGDDRYKLTNIFLNPCETLFSYGGSIAATEFLTRRCLEYYKDKHLGILDKCRQLPTIGSDIDYTPLTYDCNDLGGRSAAGRCDVKRRLLKPLKLPEIEIMKTNDNWKKHISRMKGLAEIGRNKRSPALILATVSILSVAIGTTYKTTKNNEGNLEVTRQTVNEHTSVLRDTAQFLEAFRDSVEAIESWSQEVDERLGGDSIDSSLTEGSFQKGKRASLVKQYMKWFDTQEKILLDINAHAERHQVSGAIKRMLNATQIFDRATNHSHLFECTHRVENRSLVMELDFVLPEIDENIEILEIIPMNIYRITENEKCWSKYQGPKYLLHNKTNDCIAPLNDAAVFKNAIRTQQCLKNETKTYPELANWVDEGCHTEVPELDERIQIHDINGFHKIYCFPFKIKIDGMEHDCPESPFILEANANYQIKNINHTGKYIDASITRDAIRRMKRSPIIASKGIESSKLNLSQTLKNTTSQMTLSLTRIKESLHNLPETLKFNNTTMSIFDDSITYLTNGIDYVTEAIHNIGVHVGVLSALIIFILIMPAIELVFLGLRVARIPATIWLNSARRVTMKFKSLTNSSDLFKKKRRSWSENIKQI